MSRRAWAVAVLLVSITVGGWAVAGPATAHASLVGSSPTELQILTDAPTKVLLAFDEKVLPGLSAVSLAGRSGPVALSTPQAGPGGDSSLVAIIEGAMPAGDYQVEWSAVSADDGHPSEGSYSFRTLYARVAPVAAAKALPVAEPRSDAAAVFGACRLLVLVGFVALVGGAFFQVACWPQVRSSRAWRRQMVAGYGGLVLGSLGMVLSYGGSVTGGPIVDWSLLPDTLAAPLGGALLIRLALLLAFVPTVQVLDRRVHHRSVRSSCVVLLAALLAGTFSAVSHSHSSAHPGPLVLLDVVHLVGGAVWLGGLVTLGFAVLGSPGGARPAVARFSSVAAVSVCVLVLSGCIQAWQQVGTATALDHSEYGRLVLLKVSLVVLALSLAGVVRWRLLRTTSHRASALRRLVLLEATLGLAVLGVTSVLVSTSPARTPAPAHVIAQPR